MPTWQVVPVTGTAYTVDADFMQVDSTTVKFLTGTDLVSALLARTVQRSTVAEVHELNSMNEKRMWGPW